MQAKDGGPAFPRPHSEPPHYAQEGMTLRDYFAAKALEGYLVAPDQHLTNRTVLGWDYAEVATASYNMADEMLKAREK